MEEARESLFFFLLIICFFHIPILSVTEGMVNLSLSSFTIIFFFFIIDHHGIGERWRRLLSLSKGRTLERCNA
ncbi:hypothetical protein F4809DRAFT_620585 [Biscogniauxia mediterranea]|nr:hypothetical protein F4809DRAFT_620585 [Biscogniauxia mediterranea]